MEFVVLPARREDEEAVVRVHEKASGDLFLEMRKPSPSSEWPRP
jgi:hypothetical protein